MGITYSVHVYGTYISYLQQCKISNQICMIESFKMLQVVSAFRAVLMSKEKILAQTSVSWQYLAYFGICLLLKYLKMHRMQLQKQFLASPFKILFTQKDFCSINNIFSYFNKTVAEGARIQGFLTSKHFLSAAEAQSVLNNRKQSFIFHTILISSKAKFLFSLVVSLTE